jgi:hypothetical protein
VNDQTLSDIDPDTGWSCAIARQMAKSIKIARGINERSWAILDVEPGVHVNIGKRTICEMDPRLVRLRVDVRWLPRPRSNQRNDFRILEEWLDRNEDYEHLRMIECTVTSAEKVLKIVRNSHEMAVRTLGGMATSFRKDHSEACRKKLVGIGEAPISPPDYTDHLR